MPLFTSGFVTLDRVEWPGPGEEPTYMYTRPLRLAVERIVGYAAVYRSDPRAELPPVLEAATRIQLDQVLGSVLVKETPDEVEAAIKALDVVLSPDSVLAFLKAMNGDALGYWLGNIKRCIR